jgi:fibronectin type 3 domain-containing protein
MASAVSINTETLPNGTVDKPYSASIKASGGCTPYAWTVVSGRLPAGVTKKRSSSTTSLDLTGTPDTAATYSFTVSVTDCGGHVSKKSYRVTIQAGAEHVVDLSWDASTSKDIAGYNVYRGPNGTTWQKINAGLVAATLYDDSTVANGNTYYYAVTAVNISGKESSKTPSVKVVIP